MSVAVLQHGASPGRPPVGLTPGCSWPTCFKEMSLVLSDLRLHPWGSTPETDMPVGLLSGPRGSGRGSSGLAKSQTILFSLRWTTSVLGM